MYLYTYECESQGFCAFLNISLQCFSYYKINLQKNCNLK